MKGVVVAVVVLGLLGKANAKDGATGTPAAEEEIVQRAPVRGGGNTIGEVRLVRNGGTTAVETLLRTALLRHVVGKIRDKELANWPQGRPGNDDALAYIDALEEAQSELARRARRRSDSQDRTLKMLIEFSSSSSEVSVTLWDIDVEKRGDRFRVTGERQLRSIPVTRDYVDRNMRLIIADSFGISEGEAAALLTAKPGTGGNDKDGTKTDPPHE